MGMNPALKKRFYEGLSRERLLRFAEMAGVRQFASLTHSERAERLSKREDLFVNVVFNHMALTKKDLTGIARSLGIDLAGLRSSESTEQAIRDCLSGRTRKGAKSAAPPITANDIWKEAQRLSMPVVHLKALRQPAKSQPLAAIWNKTPQGGKGKRLWLIVDLRQHPVEELRENGILHIFDSSGERGSAVLKRDKLPPPQAGQVALYAVAAKDLPCAEIVMHNAQDRLKAWGRQVKWDTVDSFSEELRPLRRYEAKWEAAHPSQKFHGGSVYAQLGGWPVTWPEESAEQQLGRRLVVRTYENSEPWLEVFRRGKSYEVRIRIT